jgi:GT2 family glycosyltransferase
MKHTKTAIVIPNWNGQDLLCQCIDSLLAQSLASTIIVVENGSVDESDKILASYGKKIVVLKQKVNLGFAGGVNVGIRYAIVNGYEYVALFNNDAVADKNWLKELVKTAKNDSNVGIVTCKFMRTDKKTLDSTGEFYTIFGLPYPRGRNEPNKGQYDNNVDVFGASGGASLYSISMLKQIGLFDEDFFAYYEDVDISFRAQLYGYDVKYAPKAIAYHHIGASSGKISGFSSYQTAKNFWILYTKNMPSWLYFKYLPLASYWFIRMFIARLIKGGFVPFFKGWINGLWLLPSTLKKRHNVQANRQVSAKYIDSILIHHKPPKPPVL